MSAVASVLNQSATRAEPAKPFAGISKSLGTGKILGPSHADDESLSDNSAPPVVPNPDLTTTNVEDKYGSIFTPLANAEEMAWFDQFVAYFIGKPRKIKRIVNCYMVARYISNILRGGTISYFDSRFNKKLLKFTILLEQWPYRMAWILLIVENLNQEKEIKTAEEKIKASEGLDKFSGSSIGESITSLLSRLIPIGTQDVDTDPQYQELSLIEIYRYVVQVIMHSSHDSAVQLQRDGDAQVFEQILLADGINRLRVKDISLPDYDGGENSLRPYAFNLQRHTIEKVSVELENCLLVSTNTSNSNLILQNSSEEASRENDDQTRLDWHASFKKKSRVFDLSYPGKETSTKL